MSRVFQIARRVERGAARWMSRHGLRLLRVGIGIVYVWFGALKFVPSLSPAEQLVVETIRFIDPRWLIPLLAVWELSIGLSFITGVFMRVSLPLMLAHMAGTLLPLITLRDETWTRFPFALTLEGQYIVKNIVLVGAALVLGGKLLRGGRRTEEGPWSGPVSAAPRDCAPPSSS